MKQAALLLDSVTLVCITPFGLNSQEDVRFLGSDACMLLPAKVSACGHLPFSGLRLLVFIWVSSVDCKRNIGKPLRRAFPGRFLDTLSNRIGKPNTYSLAISCFQVSIFWLSQFAS